MHSTEEGIRVKNGERENGKTEREKGKKKENI
jgi:hypothetical protein